MPEGLHYTVGLDPSRAMSGLAALEGGFGKVGGKVQEVLTMMFSLNGAFELVAKFRSVLGSLDDAINLEKSQARLNAFIGDMHATQGVFEDLEKLQGSTPFDKLELADVARQLLASGSAVQNVNDEVRVLATLATRAHTEIEPMMEALNRAKEMGQVDPLSFRALTGAGVVGIHEQMSKNRGQSRGELDEDLTNGRVSANDLMEAFRGLTAEGGRFFSMAHGGSVTMAMLIKQASFAWTDFKTVFESPLNDALKPVMQGWLNGLHEFTEQSKDAMKGLQIAIAQGKLGDTLYHALAAGFDTSVSYGFRGIMGLKSALGGFADAFSFVKDGNFWEGLSLVLIGAEARFVRTFIADIPAIGLALEVMLRKTWDVFLSNLDTIKTILNWTIPAAGAAISLSQQSNREAMGAAMAKAGSAVVGGSGFDDGLKMLNQSVDGFTGKLSGAFTSFTSRFQSGFAGAGNVLDPSTHQQALSDLMTAGRVTRSDEMDKDKKAVLEHAAVIREATNPIYRFGGTVQDLMGKLLGIGGGAGGGGGGGGAGGIDPLMPRGRFNVAQRAVRDFMHLSPHELAKYEFDPLANHGRGQHMGMDQAFSNWQKDHPDQAKGVQDWVSQQQQKGNDPFKGLHNFADFVKQMPAEVFRGLPGQRAIANGKDDNSPMAQLLREIRDTLRQTKPLRVG